MLTSANSSPEQDGQEWPIPRDETIPTEDGTRLKGWCWSHSNPRGVLVIAHGFGEHGGNYVQVAETLGSALGIDVLAFDFRGHGRSPGRRGWLRSYEELLEDLRAALAWADREHPERPKFLLGHSNGGLVCLRALLAGGVNVDGLILSNPTTRVVVPVPAWKLLLAGVLRRYAPWVALNAGVRPESLTQDPVRAEHRRNDRACHNWITAPFYFGMIEGGEEVIARAPEIQMPTLMLLSKADPIIDPAAGRILFERFGVVEKCLHEYAEMRHEPFNELGRCRVLRDVRDWLAQRLA